MSNVSIYRDMGCTGSQRGRTVQEQDNINNSMHTPPPKGPDPEIHSQNKKDPLLCQSESEVHEPLQRTIYVSYG